MNFEGVLGYVDRPSDRSPAGARGHRILLPMAVADKHLDGLILAPVNFTNLLDTHDTMGAQGIITDAYIRRVAKEIIVFGKLFKWQEPVQNFTLNAQADELGMSFEMKNVNIQNPGSLIWKITDFEFSGAAVLKKKVAAYNKTSFKLVEEKELR